MIFTLKKIKKIFFLIFAFFAGSFFVFAATALAATTPGQPQNVKAKAGDKQATITFTKANNNGVAIKEYVVTSSPGGKSAKTAGSGENFSVTIGSLTNGTAYTFTVKAINTKNETGPASSKSNSVTPTSTPQTTSESSSTTTEEQKVNPTGTGVGVGFPGGPNTGTDYTFPTYVKAIYAFSMKAAIALCTLMIIFAGYKYMTSRGESGSINEAKDILFSTLMGAAMLMLVVLVGYISGFDISIV